MTAGPISITNNTQRWVGAVRVAVKGTVPVREHDGTVRDRSVVVTPDSSIEVFEGDVIDVGGGRYRVSIDVPAAVVTLTPVDA